MSNVTDELWNFLEQIHSYSTKTLLDKVKFITQNRLDVFQPTCPTNEYLLACALLTTKRQQQKETTLLLLMEMYHLEEQFQRCAVRVAYMKGPLFGNLLYDDLATRPTSDIDIYVKYEYIGKVIDILNQSGYSYSDGNSCSYDDYLYDFYRGDRRLKIIGRHAVFIKHKNNFRYTVELHVTPFRHYESNSNIDLLNTSEEIFRNTQTQECQGKLYTVLNHCDNFLMLCSHFARHTVEELTTFCSSNSDSCPISLNHLHDIALYYEKFKNKLIHEKIIERARKFRCTADLSFTLKYLSQIYKIQPFYCMSEKETDALLDIENTLYIAISENISADKLIFEDRRFVLCSLRDKIPPQKIYYCQPIAQNQLPIADCPVCEKCDSFSSTSSMRQLMSFSWGSALFDNYLYLCVKIPENEIEFADTDPDIKQANTAIRIYLPSYKQEHSICTDVYEIKIYSFQGELHTDTQLNEKEIRLECTILHENGYIMMYPKIMLKFAHNNSLRFMISREIFMSRPHNPKHKCNFAVRWINSVAISHKTCLSFGELRR